MVSSFRWTVSDRSGAFLALGFVAVAGAACGGSSGAPAGAGPTSGGDAGAFDAGLGSAGDSGADAGSAEAGAPDAGSQFSSAEICSDPAPGALALRFQSGSIPLAGGTGASCTSPAACASDEACVGGTCQLLPKVFLPVCNASPCMARNVDVVVDPDTCATSALTFASANPAVAAAPASTSFSPHKDRVTIAVQAGATAGTTRLDATVYASPKTPTACTTDATCPSNAPTCHAGTCALGATASLAVTVLAPTPPACPASASIGSLTAGGLLASGPASIAVPTGANAPDIGSVVWDIAPFAASIACAAGSPPSGYVALGPAITFGPADTVFPRELPLSIPIDPAGMPVTALLRHVQVSYSGPRFIAPRVIPVTDLHVQQTGTGAAATWALGFSAPRLGTYQAVIASSAGATAVSRELTHRAVLGVSMGGGAAASFGVGHHDQFDVVAALGGPVDRTSQLAELEHDTLAGFRPIQPGTTLSNIPLSATMCDSAASCKADEQCLAVNPSVPSQGECLPVQTATDPYAHTEVFDAWWLEQVTAGDGRPFDRTERTGMLRDYAYAFGNVFGYSLAPGAENLPAGVAPNDPSVVGDHTGSACAPALEPICPVGADGTVPATCAALTGLQQASQNCGAERCAHTLTLQNYFDARYNPDGVFPAITFCDGSASSPSQSPYADVWSTQNDGEPFEVSLAIDYNGNGVRDQLEPVVLQGHEPWRDYGVDGIPDTAEPGYVAGTNDDPNGDDYDPQYNPGGTEGDARYEVGEPYDDFGLDGVAGTAQQPKGGWQKPGDGYDVGEGDGMFTASAGLQRAWNGDARSVIRGTVAAAMMPGGALTDAALSRVDVWTDGGLRDPFNSAARARHLVGALASRGRLAGALSGFTQAPGLSPSAAPASYTGRLVDFTALPGVVLQRYGEVAPAATDLQDGSGQALGTAVELQARVAAALYFIGSRWRDQSDLFLHVDPTAPAVTGCSEATATFAFASGSAPPRPVVISFPPGYCASALQSIQYPVIYVAHGYGQTAADLEPTVDAVRALMNDPAASTADRLAKAIVVYVDGRCRTGADGVTGECLRDSYFVDSPRASGPQLETWWVALMAHVDATYRTLGPDTIQWIE
jgi:hypothetical protein